MDLEKKYKYKFSIVMAIYNVEKYLEEAILSVVNQDIGFEESVQLILVNDGSPDNSNIICEKYKNKYSNNIVYIEKENGGVSSARNLGKSLAEGKYINFLDSDDKLELNALSIVYDFFEKNIDDIDIVAIPQYFFEGKTGPHHLIYKFKESEIIDINKNYNYIQLSVTSSFIKQSTMEKYEFDEEMNYSEDVHLITRILLDKFKYGVVKEAKHWYRKRITNNSALQTANTKKEWYSDHIKKLMLGLINYSLEKVGIVPLYVQYEIMYDLQWKIREKNIDFNILSVEEQFEFKEYISEVLSYIDDSIIMEQKSIPIEHKLFCLKLKYKEHLQLNEYTWNNNIIYTSNKSYIYQLKRVKIGIEFIKIQEEKLILDCHIPKYDFINWDDINICAKDSNGKSYSFLKYNCTYRDVYSINEKILHKEYFKIIIPLKDIKNDSLVFRIVIKSKNIEIVANLDFYKYVRLMKQINKSYFIENGYCVVYQNNRFHVLKSNSKVKYGREFHYIKELFKKNKKVAIARIIAFIASELKRKDIWIFMDRTNKADDNAEYLFKYSLKQNDGIKKYYIINKESTDYKRLKKIGKVIPYGTIRQKLIMLISDKIISSHIDVTMRNPIEGQGRPLKTLCNFKYVFLQHGITKDDVSIWLNKYNKNIDLLITASNEEYNSFLKYNYYYNDDTIKLTGFPRYDKLENRDKKQILIAPTWRNALVNDIDEKGNRKYSDSFKYTKYFYEYNRLINDERLISICKEKGYKIIFFPHPNIQPQLCDFKRNEYVIFEPFSTSYNKLFCESSLLLTDYSSVAFDFAYIKKPVLYYQFDYEEIFNHSGLHIYNKGYFDYEKMGFGEVCYEYENLISSLINLIDKNCKMSKEYEQRVDDFYQFTDDKNCERVYKEIIKL